MLPRGHADPPTSPLRDPIHDTLRHCLSPANHKHDRSRSSALVVLSTCKKPPKRVNARARGGEGVGDGGTQFSCDASRARAWITPESGARGPGNCQNSDGPALLALVASCYIALPYASSFFVHHGHQKTRPPPLRRGREKKMTARREGMEGEQRRASGS